MSHIALNRGLKVLHHLVENRTARFKDISKLLDPISPASQMRLLRTLVSLGEVEKEGNQYRLSASSIFRMATSPHPFALRREVHDQLEDIVRKLARDTSYPAALFGWITPGTIIILNSYSPIGSDTQYRPAGEEWPLIPFHDFAQLFLAFAPGFLREDAFFRWNPYLKDDYKGKDYQSFIDRLNSIKEQGYTVSDVISESFGSVVKPVFLHEEALPRFAIGVLMNDKPGEEKISSQLDILDETASQICSILKETVSAKQLELDLSHAQLVVQEYVDPHQPEH
ncbi:MAG: hypothetical protein AB3N63_12900 [Puniceicoccaceae bacterium]